jgi:hypothetical protein
VQLPRWLAELRPWVILAIGWFLFVVYAFPGMMTMDSIQQLQEARADFYTDGHPPLMAVLWHYVDKLIGGPFGMLVIQSVAFELGLFLLLRRVFSPRRAAIAAVLVMLFPPVIAPMGVIWKDCLMAGSLVLGTAALLDDRRWVKLLGLGAMLLATAVRYNAPAATLPLIVILFTWWPVEPGIPGFVKRYGLALGAWIGVTAAALLLGAAVTDRPMYFWHSTLAIMDTAGAIAETDGTIPDEELRELTKGTGLLVDTNIHDAIRKRYSPIDFEPLTFHEGHIWESLPIAGTEPAPPEKRAAVARMFRGALSAYPGGYLVHRATVMKYVLGLHDGPVYSPVMMHRLQYTGLLEKLGVSTHATGLQSAWQRRVQWFARHTPLFRPWMYVVLALILLAFCRGHRDVFALLLSGLGLEASLFLLAPTPDYRYSHWLVVCVVISTVMLVARRARV